MPYKRRVARKRQIIIQMYMAWLTGQRLTTHQIASRVGLVPSQHLRRILNEMVLEGYLYLSFAQHRPNIQKSLFVFNKRGTERHDPETLAYLETHFGEQLEMRL